MTLQTLINNVKVEAPSIRLAIYDYKLGKRVVDCDLRPDGYNKYSDRVVKCIYPDRTPYTLIIELENTEDY